MLDLLKFIKSTGIYLLGNVLAKTTQFLMLPLYTKYLNPEDYGTFDLYVAYITFLSSILFFDIWGGIMRFMFDYKEDEEKAKPVTNGMCIFVSSTLMYTIFVIILGNILDIQYIEWLYLYGLTANMVQVVGYVARALHKDYIFAIGGVGGSLVNMLCNVVFIAVLRLGYEYLYISYCMGMITNIVIVGSNIHFNRLVKKKYCDKDLFKTMLHYAMPLSLNSAAYWFLTSYNKLVISQNLSVAENGLYAVASKFSAMINLVTQCFQMAWQELTFSKAGSNREEMDTFYTKAVNEYIKFMGFGMLLLIPFVKIVFPIMIDDSYAEAENLIPVAFLGAWFSCISSFLASIISTLKKNRMIFTTTLAGSVVNILIIHLLIRYIGMYAAVVSLAAGYSVVVLRRLQLLKKYLTIKLDKGMLGLLIIFFVGLHVIYVTGNLLINFIALCVEMSIALFCYRDIIKEFYIKLRGR